MIEDRIIENVRKNANIIDIISSYIPLTQKGKNYFCVCPFHEDHSPSMSVSEGKQIYKCFSCGAAGNVFTFVKEYENVSFLEAVKIVADKCGLTFNAEIKKTSKVNTNKAEYEIMSLSLKYYQNNLNTEQGKLAKKYLQERDLDDNVIKDFDIGLALSKDQALYKLLLGKKYSIEALLSLGLINRNGEHISDAFNNRIIFPIHDLEGSPIGFTGRIYEKNDQAKYINSKESPIFKKGQILFNYHRAKNEIKRKKEVILVEGNMDAIRMYSSGIKNVVALMGTSLTKEQVNIIKNLRAKVILMFDNDNAGEIATIQNGDILVSSGINPYIVRLSGEKDPDEYIIKKGKDAIINNLNNPLNFLDFKLRYYKKNKDLSKTNDLVKYIKEIINSIKDIDDELMKTVTLKKMSEEYDISLDILTNELKKVTKPKENIKPAKKALAKTNLSKYDIAAQNIIYFMMNDGSYIERFKKELGYFNIKKYRDISNEIIYYYEYNKSIDLSSFITFALANELIYEDVMEIIKSINLEELTVDDFEDFIRVCESELKKEEIKNLKEQIANELDENKKLELAKKLIEIKKGCVCNE